MDDLTDTVRSTMSRHDLVTPDTTGLLRWAHRSDRRRRALLPAAIAASVALVIGAAATVIAIRPDSDSIRQVADFGQSSPSAANATEASGSMTPAGNWQTVRYGDKYTLTVPASWKIPDLKCGVPQSDTVVFSFVNMTTVGCGSPPDTGRPAIVRLTFAGDRDFVHFPIERATGQTTIDGMPAKIGRFGPTILVIIPSIGSMISISTTDPTLREDILKSISVT